MQHEAFEHEIRRAISSLPRRIQNAMNNVAFVVEDERRTPQGREVAIRNGTLLLGFYEGIPLAHRGSGYQWVLPDKITIFQKAIEELSGGEEKRTKEIVRSTVLHEIAHHVGFTEQDVRRWEKKRQTGHPSQQSCS
ncbi:MAG: metallopeptidase family protein [bacterium]